jgi:hypothetical protein
LSAAEALELSEDEWETLTEALAHTSELVWEIS